ncbi:ribonuclease H-like domain-containing protein [Tanacetum coccineum]
MQDPRELHFSTLKRILRYVRGTIYYGLRLHVSNAAQLTTYMDCAWAGFPVTRRSTIGYCVFLRDNLLSWSAKRQATLYISSTEAEYRGVANVVTKKTWLRNLLCELHAPIFSATLVYCDNEITVPGANGDADVKRAQTVANLFLAQKIRYDCDIKATNIILLGLLVEIYTLINHFQTAKEIWDRVKELIEGTELTLKERESKLYDEFDRFTSEPGESIHSYYWRYAKLIDNIK